MKTNKEHVKDYFPDWMEGRLDKKEQDFVSGHLEECDSCRSYYQTMQSVIEKPDSDSLPTLEKDPYLPARIKQKAESKHETDPVSVFGLSKLLTASLVVLGLFLGFLMGQLLVYNAQTNNESTDYRSVTELYYEGMIQPGIGSNFEQALTEMEGDQQ